ncbi:hypothetical protein [Marinobacterium aestuariivivens]|uniref:Uncharacterized protein n=1 Tax=Marinobacterium aestuariivivens TaxID=1698799 RepID=A0ABW2AA62_9GAMM
MMNNLSALESVLFDDRSVRQLLGSFNQNEMQQLSGEIYAKLYWRKRKPDWYKDDSNRLFARLRQVQRIVKKRLKTGNVKPELTENGCVMERFNFPLGDSLDFCQRFLRHPGWQVVLLGSSHPYCPREAARVSSGRCFIVGVSDRSPAKSSEHGGNHLEGRCAPCASGEDAEAR